MTCMSCPLSASFDHLRRDQFALDAAFCELALRRVLLDNAPIEAAHAEVGGA
jgi:hypothetical protein